MQNIRYNSIALYILLLMIFSITNFAVASEVTGTLSSNGDSAETNQAALLGEIDITSDEANGQAVTQSTGQLQGSVVQGRDDSGVLAVANPSSWDMSTWLILLGVMTLALLAFVLRSRKLI